MADIEFNCPKCQHQLVVDERGAGRKANCPKCGEGVTIPAPSAPHGLTCPKCGAISPTPNAKFCMKCATNLQLSLESVKCPNCSADLPLTQERYEALIGSDIHCFKCNKTFAIPFAAPTNAARLRSEPPAPVKSPPPPPIKKPFGWWRKGQPAAATPNAHSRGITPKCRYCGEELEPGAFGCAGCGRDFRPGSRVRYEKTPSRVPEAASGCWDGIVKLCKAIGILFVIGLGISIWQEQSKKSSSETGAATSNPSQQSSPPVPAPPPPPPPKSPEELVKESISAAINKCLTAWSAGRYPLDMQHLIAPTEWKIRDIPIVGDKIASATVFVKSSNRGGMPIQGLYCFFIEKNEFGVWRVAGLMEQ